ncbi:MAG: hypothetical protein HFE63_02805 [Clostridiales bacterium]|nr:hypothetical protein [Clostridiales bacterium]
MCNQNPVEVVDLSDTLVISPYIFSKDITDPIYANNMEINGSFEELKLNEIRYVNGYSDGMANINIRFNFDGGIIELISDSCDIQLSTGNSAEPFKSYENIRERKYSDRLTVSDGGYIAINPIASKRGCNFFNKGDPDWDMSDGYVGRKYYLTVNAYDFSNVNSPVITAKLELIQLEDTAFPDGKGSAYYSIELISYEYSDTYKMMEGYK